MLQEAVQRWMNELSAQGILITDTDLIIQGWNHWLEVHSGRAANTMIGQHLFDAYPELIERGLNKYYEDVLDGQVRLLSHRFHHYLLPMASQPDEDTFPQMQQSARIAPLINQEQVIGTITVIDDVTERIAREVQLMRLLVQEQAARKEAEQANRLKDEFLATVSHELRTPLNAIAGWLHIFRMGAADANSLTQGLDTIERNVIAQTQIVEDILDVSRIITGKLSLDVKPVTLIPIIEAALDAVRLAASAKNIDIQLNLDPQTGSIAGDQNRIQQIVWNLLANAIKFTPQGGTVSIELNQPESQAEIVVTDNGKGITPDFLPHVFERFRQADSTTTRQHSGLGLGLAIVRHLVEIHGGTVQASSAGVGKGATFTVRLPVLVNQAAEPDTARVETHPPQPEETLDLPRKNLKNPEASKFDGMRVLIVDDDIDSLEMLQILLTQFGADVKVSESTRAALSVLDGWLPDVLISDIGMPNEDGYSLIRQIRSRDSERGGQIPAIALTGYTRLEDRQRLLAAGYQVPLAKPVDLDELVTTITTLTAPSPAHSELT
jgi:signal transduction histidine kinase/ActR/RegA family two-component response regulator